MTQNSEHYLQAGSLIVSQCHLASVLVKNHWCRTTAWAAKRKRLLVDVFTVANSQDQYDQLVIFYVADHAVGANAVTPQSR